MEAKVDRDMIESSANVPMAGFDCGHGNVKVFGVSGSTTYFRCGCGLLLVALNGQLCPFGRAVG